MIAVTILLFKSFGNGNKALRKERMLSVIYMAGKSGRTHLLSAILNCIIGMLNSVRIGLQKKAKIQNELRLLSMKPETCSSASGWVSGQRTK